MFTRMIYIGLVLALTSCITPRPRVDLSKRTDRCARGEPVQIDGVLHITICVCEGAVPGPGTIYTRPAWVPKSPISSGLLQPTALATGHHRHEKHGLHQCGHGAHLIYIGLVLALTSCITPRPRVDLSKRTDRCARGEPVQIDGVLHITICVCEGAVPGPGTIYTRPAWVPKSPISSGLLQPTALATGHHRHEKHGLHQCGHGGFCGGADRLRAGAKLPQPVQPRHARLKRSAE